MDDEKMCSHSRFSFADDFFPLPLVEGEKGWTEGVKKKICFLFLLVPYSRLHLQVKMGFLLLVRPDVEASIEAEKKFGTDLFSANESTFVLFSWWCLKSCNDSIVGPRFSSPNFPEINSLQHPVWSSIFHHLPPPISSFPYSYICFINQTLYTSWRFPHKCVSVRAKLELIEKGGFSTLGEQVGGLVWGEGSIFSREKIPLREGVKTDPFLPVF